MFFSIIYGVIIPAGFHIFQRGRLNQQPVNGPCFGVFAPTRYPTGHPPKDGVWQLSVAGKSPLHGLSMGKLSAVAVYG